MKRMKVVFLTLLSIALILLPFALPCVIALATPPQYENTFVGVLDEKFERLNSIEEDKIVIIGGSSVAFGVDSALIEEYVGMPTVNFGLYATLGTKLMLDLSKSAVKSGDVIIVAPELDAQTLSLYFNTESTLQAMDGNWSMARYVDSDNFFSLVGGMWNLAANKLSYMKTGAPAPDGVYSAESFNEYLDISYPREENAMHLYYDPNAIINLDKSIVSKEFTDYLNDYISYCEFRGATVYFSYCPMNELAVVDSSYENLSEFEEYLKENINCEFISSIEDYVLEAEYFYDTNFHLNDYGKTKHSVNLIKDILLEFEIPKLVEAPVGAEDAEGLVQIIKPALPFVDYRYYEWDENEIYFEYEQSEQGYYTIVGLSEIGKTMTSLTVPKGANGYVVSAIAEGAFSDSLLEELTVPEETELKIFMNGAFRGASHLKRLVMLHPKEDDIIPPADFIGVSEEFCVYIPEGSNYDSGYNWGERGLKFERIEE